MTIAITCPPALPAFELLKPMEVIQYLRISKSTCYRMIQEGTIRAKRVRGTLLIPRDEVIRVQRDYLE